VALFLALLSPISPAGANGDTPAVVDQLDIQGVTPPVAGATPIASIPATVQYTGTISWSSKDGQLVGNFQTETIYAATINLTPNTGFTFTGVGQDSFSVDGASYVYNSDNGSGEVLAIFKPALRDAVQSLDISFADHGSLRINDFFGESPLNETSTAVGAVKVDRIAVDSLNRIVVLASFYEDNNQETEVLDSLGTAIGTGFLNTRNITAQTGNEPGSSAAVEARRYISNNSGLPFKDWYVPAKDELSALYAQKAAIGGLNEVAIGALNANYWSSSQYSASTAWSQNFLTGTVGSKKKDRELAVRPIRSGTVDNPVVGQPGPGGGKIFYVSDTNFQCGPTLSLTCNYLEAAPANWFSISGNDPSISWSSPTGIDNHILFRLNSNGSYDTNFGDTGRSLRKFVEDFEKPYVLVTTTCLSYTETLDLEIDAQNRILILLSGSANENECGGASHNFVARYTAAGGLDLGFGDNADGVIGTLTPSTGSVPILFSDLTLDDQGRILLAIFSSGDIPEALIVRFLSDGSIDYEFGTIDEADPDRSRNGTSALVIGFSDIDEWLPYRTISIIADNSGGYIIAFIGIVSTSPSISFTQLQRLDQNGDLDLDFAGPEEFSSPDGNFIMRNFLFTDLIPDGPSGFIISGSYFDISSPEFSFATTYRFKMDGSFDTAFLDQTVNANLNPLISNSCTNVGLLKNYLSYQKSNGVVLANFCGDSGAGERFKTFSASGVFHGEYSLQLPLEEDGQLVNQLIETENGKVVVLKGSRPTQGLWAVLDAQLGIDDFITFSQPTIRRYEFLAPPTPPTPPTPTPPTPVPVAVPVPVPYIKTLTTPKLNLKDGNLICTPGTYNAGYTLDGVVQGSATALFTPSTFTYNLLINGITQISLSVTSPAATATWTLSTSTSGSLLSCSVTVSANGVTNTDKSTDNTSALSSATSTLTTDNANADAAYTMAQSANAKAYQKALVDNRANWRTEIAAIRTNYFDTVARINAQPKSAATNKKMITDKSTALKVYIAAQKKSAADYKASQPAAAAARDAANKAALDAKNTAIAKAKATYGTFIESIGYGVLIP
jgi:hypothetical protein